MISAVPLFNEYPNQYFSKQPVTVETVLFFSFIAQGYEKSLFYLSDQALAKLAEEFCTGKRNLKISVDISERGTGRFYSVWAEIQQMH